MRKRRLTAATLTAAAITVLSPPVALSLPAAVGSQVMPVTATAQCSDPTVTSVRVAVSADIENPAHLGPVPEHRRITGTATLPADTIAALGVATVEGQVTLQLAITGKFSWRASTTLHFPRTPVVAGQDLVVEVVGYAGAYASYLSGDTFVDVTGVDLALKTRRADTAPWPRKGITALCSTPPARWMSIVTDSAIYEFHPAPNNFRVTGTTTDSITLAWNKSYGLMGPPYGYEILLDDVVATRVMGADTLTGTVTGLKPDTGYWLRVKAIELGGERRSNPLLLRTLGTHTTHYFDTNGTFTVKGSKTAVRGEHVGTMDLATGTHASSLAFNPTDIRLGRYGTGHAEFSPIATATGTYQGGVYTVASRQKVTLSRITVQGQVHNLPNCSTEVDLPLSSGPNFNPNDGGTLAATFTIPPFTNCGQFTNLINYTVPGSGNTANLIYTPYS
ncbi:hypothetical protein Aglo01_04970 [Actinokineospora globicatena]|nr:hypothetical protein Aglo01_04970 [Actinokineospora globicatena]GLW82853.1 hypothetical protein Aglo02_04930 [Actinokineospora globicatena]